MAANVLKVAQSKLEWLRDTLMRVFDHTRENPFACRRAPSGSHRDIARMTCVSIYASQVLVHVPIFGQ